MNTEYDNKKVTMEDLVNMVRSKTGMRKEDIFKCVHSLLGVISQCVDSGQYVAIPDFGAFGQRNIKGRRYILPDKSTIITQTHSVVRFRPYKCFTSYYIKNQL